MSEKLTQKDVDRIQAEIEERKLVERPRLLEAVKEARAQGDLSENFEYTAAKREKNRNESRIRYLERVLKNASIVRDYSRDDEVGIEKTVRVMFEEDESEEEYCIVTPIRCNSLENKISIESPIGKALMGHRAGDRVEVLLPNGAVSVLQILSISNTVDDGTDRLRSY